MRASRLLLSLGLVGALYVQPLAARADVVPPGSCSGVTDTAPCSGKKAGDSCSFSNGTAGSCAATRCTTDGGTAVLQCVATGAGSMGGCSAARGSGPATRSELLGVFAALLCGSLSLMRRRRPA